MSHYLITISYIAKVIEDARLRQTSEAPEHRWTLWLGWASLNKTHATSKATGIPTKMNSTRWLRTQCMLAQWTNFNEYTFSPNKDRETKNRPFPKTCQTDNSAKRELSCSYGLLKEMEYIHSKREARTQALYAYVRRRIRSLITFNP